MKSMIRVAPVVSSVLVAGLLAGCAAAAQKSADHDHAGMGTMDMQAMCDRHKKMRSGKPAAEQQATMQEHMKSMTPEMRQRMQAMHEQCR